MWLALLPYLKRFVWPLAILAALVVWTGGVYIVATRAEAVRCELDQLEEQLELGQTIAKADRKIIAASPKSGDIDEMLKYTRKHAIKRD